jgi:hypothetical protein
MAEGFPSPRKFSPTRSLGIPQQDYRSFWDGEPNDMGVQLPVQQSTRTTGSSATFRPDRGYSSRSMMVTPYDAFTEQIAETAAQNDLAALNAQKRLYDPQTELFSPEGRQVRAENVLRGGLHPHQEAAIERLDTSKPTIPTEVVRAASALEMIDPSEPAAWEKTVRVLADLDSDPEIGSVIKTHPYFRETFQDLKRQIQTMRNRAPEETDPRLWFATRGGDPAEFDAGKFNTPEGKLDRARMAYRLAQLKNTPDKEISATEIRQLDEAAEMIGEISDSRKVAAFRAAAGRDPETEEDWRAAWQLADRAVAPDREALAAIVTDLEAQGRAVPSRYKMKAGLMEEQAQEATPVQQPTQSISKEEYEALPSGAQFVWQGKTLTKK